MQFHNKIDEKTWDRRCIIYEGNVQTLTVNNILKDERLNIFPLN